MEANFTCEECGGTEYYLESGFYYCRECQTQAREFREAVFETQETTTPSAARGARLTRMKKKISQRVKMSTFETFNYVLLGLVNELIEAGASKDLKPTVKTLWLKYLEKLEVIGGDVPKLSAVYSKVDAEIFYNRKRKKPQRRASGSSSSDDISSVASSSQSRARQRREFVHAGYEQEMSQEASSTNTSQNLQSLKSPEAKTTPNNKLRFNKAAKRELLRRISRKHLHEHCKDEHMELKCHKTTYRTLSTVYKSGPQLLTKNKLYSLIHLGLLLTKDNIQLGDLLRWIREGHVSYNRVRHFFPEEFADKDLNLTNYSARKMPLTHFGTRQTSAGIAALLNISYAIPVQNLVNLCERYCQELNLPDEFCGCVLNIISKAAATMQQHDSCSTVVPNYEARAMAFIIFTLKLLFGLDDVTEHNFSDFARIVNNINDDSDLQLKQMFVFDDWMKHIQYRKHVLRRYHFPTSFLNDRDIKDVDVFVNFLKDSEDLLEDDEQMPKQWDAYYKLLTNIAEKDIEHTKFRFPLSCTPFRDYANIVWKSSPKNKFLPILQDDYSSTSVDFLLRPYGYLKLVNEDKPYEVKHRGANKNMRFVEIENYKVKHVMKQRRRRKWVAVEIGNLTPNVEEKKEKAEEQEEIDGSNIFRFHQISYERRHRKNAKALKKLSEDKDFPQYWTVRDEDVYNVHYNPYETYWLTNKDIDRCGGEEGFQKFLDGFPHSFVLLLEEGARILEMYKKHLLEEFMNVELYLGFVADFPKRGNVEVLNLDGEMRKLIDKAALAW